MADDDLDVLDDVKPGVKPAAPVQSSASTFDLDNTVNNLMTGANSMLTRGQKAFDAQEAERPELIKKMEGRQKTYDEQIKALSDMEAPKDKPTWSVPTWQAPDPQYDPVSSWGSAASVLGIMASAFTRKPLQNSITAMTGVMQAGQAADKLAYDRAWKEYTTETEVALKKIDFEKTMYQNAIDLFKTDFNQGMSVANAGLAAMGNEKAMFLLKHDPEKFLEYANSYVKAADGFQKSFDYIDDKRLEDQFVSEQRAEAQKSGQPWGAQQEIEARDQARDLLSDKRQVRRAGGTSRADQMLEWSKQKQAEIAEATSTLQGPELAEKLVQIKAKYDELSRSLYAPKDVAGAGDIGKDLRAIDDAMPIIEAMDSLVNYSQEVVGVKARGNAILGSVVGQLGGNISNEAARVAAVRQLTGMLEGPMARIYTGSGQWSKAKSEMLGSINPATNIMTTPEVFHNAMNFLKTDLPQKKERRQGELNRQPASTTTPAITPPSVSALPAGIPAGSKKVGTKDGNDVYETPEGKRLMVTK